MNIIIRLLCLASISLTQLLPSYAAIPRDGGATISMLRIDSTAQVHDLPIDLMAKPLTVSLLSDYTTSINYAPCFVNDEAIFFVSNRAGSMIRNDSMLSHDLWTLRIPADRTTKIGSPVNLESINTPKDEGAVTICRTTQTAYFTGCNQPDGVGACDIYEFSLVGNNNVRARNLGRNINTDFWESMPTVTQDGKRLYFISNRPLSKSDEDAIDFNIWYSDWDPEHGDWTKARILSRVVNSHESEMSPFIDDDGTTLYFSSMGHAPNVGGQDIYRTTRTGEVDNSGEEVWTKPELLPTPLNSWADDIFFVIHPRRQYVLLNSDRDGSLQLYRAQP